MALLNSRGEVVRRELPPLFARARPDLVRPLKQIEQEHIESAMILCAGDRNLAADRLRISRATLYRKVKRIRSEE
jgi:transcriptional regulator of acetoin/glycerol metabolism